MHYRDLGYINCPETLNKPGDLQRIKCKSSDFQATGLLAVSLMVWFTKPAFAEGMGIFWKLPKRHLRHFNPFQGSRGLSPMLTCDLAAGAFLRASE